MSWVPRTRDDDPDSTAQDREARIARGAAAGYFDALPIGDTCWQLVRNDLTIFFYPKTARWSSPGTRKGRGWVSAMKALKVPGYHRRNLSAYYHKALL